MTQPYEMKLNLPMGLSNDVMSTTAKVWDMLVASKEGDLDKVKTMTADCPDLIYAQYNYTPPIHFAVREGHIDLVRYLLEQGALASGYITYPFKDNLLNVAEDRGYEEILKLLKDYLSDPARWKFKGDNGKIEFNRSELELEFQQAVDQENYERSQQILKQHPEFALDETYFWGEGILLFAAKENNRSMMDLLFSHGARVPDIIKWGQFYYFERLDGAQYLMEHGMNPNTRSWQEVTLLHDMAQKGFLDKASLLIQYGADLNPIDDEYQSTPLGIAARWGHADMVKLLLNAGADPDLSGAHWSTPLSWSLKKNHSQITELLVQAGAH